MEEREALERAGVNFKNLSREHSCEHDSYMARSGIAKAYKNAAAHRKASLLAEPAPNLNEYKKRQTTTPQSIRMYMDTSNVKTTDSYSCQRAGQQVQMERVTYTCRSIDVLTQAKVDLLTQYIAPAMQASISEMIRLPRVSGNLVLPDEWFKYYAIGYNCRVNLPVPSYLTSTGQPNADYYMFVIMRPIGNNGTLANAAPCAHNYLGSYLDRPLAGSINFNPGSDLILSLIADPTDAFLFDQVLKLGLHEITHALGFTSNLYSSYQVPAPNSGFYSGTYGPVKTLSRTNQPYPLYMMTSPRVLAYARIQYNCPTLAGVELEERDPEPKAMDGPGSHWEKRIVGNEYMSPVAASDMTVSKLTLSLFEDMGWYTANYSFAEPAYYGSQAGCSWIQNECSASTWGRYFCTDLCLEVPNCPNRCNGERTAWGVCSAVHYSSLPTYYQHTTDTAVGGTSEWNDYCPVIRPYSDRFCKDASVQSQVQNKGYGETHSDLAACFDITYSGRDDAACFEKQCIKQGSTKILTVKVANVFYNCTAAGTITVQGVYGPISLTCPDVNFFCADNLIDNLAPVSWTFNPADAVPLPPPGRGYSPTDGGADPFALEWGSTLVYILLAMGILLLIGICLIILCVCCCNGSDEDGYDGHR